eukprot:Macronucleus_2522.p1 GENE.Macronucleus_2522~~Macronucleus_2522.p1  ORF type:complete len:241 (+),score=4.94 Macronucleus_2522:1-723(+)
MITRFRHPDSEWEEAEHVATIGVDFVKKVIEVEGKRLLVQTWDTAGQERFRSITSAYFRGANGAIVCFDCTEPQTLRSAKVWIEQFKAKASPEVPVILVACKADLLDIPLLTETLDPSHSVVIDINLIPQDHGEEEQKASDYHESASSGEIEPKDLIVEGKKLAASFPSVGFISTSAKTGQNVLRCFQRLTKMIMVQKGHLITGDGDNLSDSSSQVDQHSLKLHNRKEEESKRGRKCCGK